MYVDYRFCRSVGRNRINYLFDANEPELSILVSSVLAVQGFLGRLFSDFFGG